MTGAIAESTDVDVADLAVYAKPEDAIQAEIQLGQSMHYYRLPDSAVSLAGDHYTLSVAPQDLPENTVSDSGLVTFQVVALDPGSTRRGSPRHRPARSTTASAGRSGQTRWPRPTVCARSPEVRCPPTRRAAPPLPTTSWAR